MSQKSDGRGWQAGDSGKSCSSTLKAVSWQSYFLLGKGGEGKTCKESWGEVSICPIKAFNGLDEVHPHYEEQSALLKVQ